MIYYFDVLFLWWEWLGVQEHYTKACWVLFLWSVSPPALCILTCCLFTCPPSTDAQLAATLTLQLLVQQLEWDLCILHRRAQVERSERTMHVRLLSDALIFLPQHREILLYSPLPVLWLSGCDSFWLLMQQQHAGNHSNTDACSLYGSLGSFWWNVHLILFIFWFLWFEVVCFLCDIFFPMFYLKHVLSFWIEFIFFFPSLFILIGVSISQLSILDHFTCAIVSQDLCMGLLWWFPCDEYVCVCLSVCGCVQGSSCMMDEAGTFLVMYSQFCCSVVENEKHPPASTGTTLYSPPPPPPSVSQQAEWILMEPVYHASVFPVVYQQPVPFLASL